MSDTILVVEEPEVTVVVAETETVVVVSAPGPQGPPGPSGGGFVVHEQTTPAAVWPIFHGLGRIPNWYVVESTGDDLEPGREDPTTNTTNLDFDGIAVSGTAFGS